MAKENTLKWLIVGGAIVFWLILDVAFGAGNIRNGLRVLVLVVLLIGVVMTVMQKVSQTSRTPIAPGYRTEAPGNQVSKSKCAHNPIVFHENGRLTDRWVVGLLREGTKGYKPLPDYGIFADRIGAKKIADNLNAQTGLTQWQINRIINRWS